MGLFKKQQPPAPLGNPKAEKIGKFAAEIMLSLMNDGQIDPSEITRIRSLATQLGLTPAEITESKALLTCYLMEGMVKAGMSKETAVELSKEIIIQISKI